MFAFVSGGLWDHSLNWTKFPFTILPVKTLSNWLTKLCHLLMFLFKPMLWNWLSFERGRCYYWRGFFPCSSPICGMDSGNSVAWLNEQFLSSWETATGHYRKSNFGEKSSHISFFVCDMEEKLFLLQDMRLKCCLSLFAFPSCLSDCSKCKFWHFSHTRKI